MEPASVAFSRIRRNFLGPGASCRGRPETEIHLAIPPNMCFLTYPSFIGLFDLLLSAARDLTELGGASCVYVA